MVGWHHQLDGHEIEHAPEVGDGQGSLACCSPWGRKESDRTERLKTTRIQFLDLNLRIVSMGNPPFRTSELMSFSLKLLSQLQFYTSLHGCLSLL